MLYAKFKIPLNQDGSVVTYSPGWCGTRDKCALNEKGLLYNDKELWGIMSFEGDYVPDDVEVIDEKTALFLLSQADETDEKVYFGDKLLHRYDVKVEPLPKELTDITLDEFREVING